MNHPYLDPDPEPVVKSMCPACDNLQGDGDDDCKCKTEDVELLEQFALFRSRYIKLKSMNMVARARLWRRAALGEDMDAIIDRMEMPKQ